MPKFVWTITARGQWCPQLFHGELPREITQPHNADRYVVHDVSPGQMAMIEALHAPLRYLANEFPPPPPFTGKEP